MRAARSSRVGHLSLPTYRRFPETRKLLLYAGWNEMEAFSSVKKFAWQRDTH